MDERSGRPSGTGAAVALVTRTARGAQKDRVVGLGAEVAFFALLSLPPALLAILGGIGYVANALGPQMAARIRDQILLVSGTVLTPQTVENLVAPTVNELLQEGRADVVSFGVVVALWSASRATKVLMEAVSIAYNEPALAHGIRRRLIALVVTLIGMVVAAVVVPLLVAGPRLGEAITEPLGIDELLASVWRVLYWPVIGIFAVLLVASLYHVSPPRGKTTWGRELPGALLAVVVWLAGGVALRIYALWTIQGDTVYGPLTAPIVVLLWLFVTAVALLLGAELNAEIEGLWPSPPGGADQTPARPPAAGAPTATEEAPQASPAGEPPSGGGGASRGPPRG